MTKTIDAATALATLRAVVADAVAEHGPAVTYNDIENAAEVPADYRGACLYVTPDDTEDGNHTYKSLCIVGQALVRLGVDPAFLDGFRTKTIVKGPLIDALETEQGIELTTEALSIFSAAQGAQDSMRSWPDALTRAETLDTLVSV